MVNSYKAGTGRTPLGRLRVWCDATTDEALAYLYKKQRLGASKAVGAGVTLLAYAYMEKNSGRRVVTMDQDGTNIQDIF